MFRPDNFEGTQQAQSQPESEPKNTLKELNPDFMADPERNPHRVLGVNENAGREEIEAAWRRLVQKYHPDKNLDDSEATEKIQKINKACEVLGGFERRDPSRSTDTPSTPQEGTKDNGKGPEREEGESVPEVERQIQEMADKISRLSVRFSEDQNRLEQLRFKWLRQQQARFFPELFRRQHPDVEEILRRIMEEYHESWYLSGCLYNQRYENFVDKSGHSKRRERVNLTQQAREVYSDADMETYGHDMFMRWLLQDWGIDYDEIKTSYEKWYAERIKKNGIVPGDSGKNSVVPSSV